MKAAVVFIFLLSLVVVQNYRIGDSNDNELDDQIRQSFDERFDALIRQRQLEMQQQQQRLEAERKADSILKKKCDQHGPPDAYDNLKVALGDFKSCAQNALISNSMPAENGRAGLKTCRILRPIGSCVVKVDVALQPCMSPERRRNLPIVNITHSAISYACDDDASRLRDFIDGGGVDCFKKNIHQMKQCATTMDYNEVVTSVESGEVTENDCQKVAGMEECMLRQLRTCYHPAAATFFKGMLDAVNKYSPCYRGPSQHLLNGSSSS